MQLPYVPYAAGQRNHVKYIEVDVEDLSDTVIALNDSGSQLCVVRADTVRALDLPVFGQVKLKEISVNLVPANVVKIPVKNLTTLSFLALI